MRTFFPIVIFSYVLFLQCYSYQTASTNEVYMGPFVNRQTVVQNILNEIHNVSSNLSICKKCEFVAKTVLTYRRNGANRETMASLFADMCYELKGYTRSVCRSLSNIQTDVFLYIIDNTHVNAEEVCGTYFQKDGCINSRAKKWVIDIPPENNDGNEHEETIVHYDPLKIIQITDVHYDPSYKEGSNAKCELPLCCEEQNGIPTNPSDAAGMFGDYRTCDMPRKAILNLLNEIRTSQRDIDYIYFTGDIIAHNDWETSKMSNLKTIKEFYDYIFQHFPNISVYPILGNHEAYPCNLYSPLNISESSKNSIGTRWLFDAVAEYWSKWLPKSALETIKIGGFYTTLVRQGFRIIALNSNVCFTENYWLIYDDEDPYGQLKWLVKILSEAEKNKEKVHILSHIPSGEANCHKQWQYNFNRIVQRFSKTISAHFNGHTHVDELRLYKNGSNPNQVINVAYNGGSFTTFIGLNPDYRVYDIDPQNLMVLDFHQYTFNLSLANTGNQHQPEWYQLYSFKKAYNLDNLSYDNLNKFYENLMSDRKLAEQYVQYHVRNSEFAFDHGCNETCIQSQVCHITAITAEDSIKCGIYNIFS
ncbi:hypothetical protein WA026_007267 [Henosepilachna vigintioctopunctata]|uniref:Sphingomyelin phosphodiesterase n=1 Tax=Henosepilachna vigintioctopunctata TaxID=420089 RepID=A0AAW1UWT8_9CUCU